MAENKINLEENSKYRVAFDLMKEIAIAENKWGVKGEKARPYYLKLYAQTIRIVSGHYDYDEVMKAVPTD